MTEFTVKSGDRTIVGVSSLGQLAPADQGAGLIAMLKAYAAERRWRLENGGTTIAGLAVRTDEATRAALSQAVQVAALTPGWSTAWKFGDGSFGTIDAAKAGVLFSAVAAFVSSCFAKEQAVAVAIAAGTITTTAQIDAMLAGG